MPRFYGIKRLENPFPASVSGKIRDKCYQQEAKPNTKAVKMSCEVLRLTLVIVCVVVVLLSLADITEANYKNAPMNGIMFGKRGPNDYDSRSKTFTALCEIATEACQAWFPSQENK